MTSPLETTRPESANCQESLAFGAGLFAAYLQHVDDSVFVLNTAGAIIHLSQSASRRFSPLASDLLGQPFASQLQDVPAGGETQNFPPLNRQQFKRWLSDATAAQLKSESSASLTTELCVRLGVKNQSSTMQGHAVCCWGEGDVVCFVTLRDVQRQLDREAQLSREATTDALTGLLNRRGFQARLEQHLGRPVALAILDVDHFKKINDSGGHQVGDEVLQEITACIACCLTDSFSNAVLARLGGDEFGIVIPVASNADSAGDNPSRSVEDRFTDLTETVRASMNQWKTPATFSMGVAVDLTGRRTARELLACADKAMYEAKADGRAQIRCVEAVSLET